ncbi:MAG: glycogen/starch synthase [Paludibacteraceae bacterium]|jgi:starch synthase|nr:glycogen/starch synthase [Paludibacteraceae bacterium]
MSQNPLRVLFISQEITPYLPETIMSQLCRKLPQSVQENGLEIRIFMPRFGCINERRNQLHEVQRLSGMNLIINDTDHPLIIKVASIQAARMQVYFIDNEDYFQRKALFTDEKGEEFDDNEDRSIFFVRGVLETIKKLRWTPDVIHCHGWMTALTPLYVKKVYSDDPFFSSSKMVYSLYEDKFKKMFSKEFSEKLMMDGISDEDVALIKQKEVSYEDLTKLAIDFSDAVIVGTENVDTSLIDYTKEQNKKLLEYVEDYVQPYISLYKSL